MKHLDLLRLFQIFNRILRIYSVRILEKADRFEIKQNSYKIQLLNKSNRFSSLKEDAYEFYKE